jgi:hypothetical protein
MQRAEPNGAMPGHAGRTFDGGNPTRPTNAGDNPPGIPGSCSSELCASWPQATAAEPSVATAIARRYLIMLLP